MSSTKLMTSSAMTLTLMLLLSAVAVVRVEGRAGGRPRRDRGETESLLKKMVGAVQKGADFFAADYSTLNLDGLFGLRMGQGQIVEAARECKSSPSCPDELQRHLAKMTQELEVTGQTALGYVERKDSEYLRKFMFSVDRPYILRYEPVTWSEADLSTVEVGSDTDYIETNGDACLSRLAGSFRENGRDVPRCNTTEACWAMMTKPNTAMYTITHQLLYFLTGEQTGCVDTLESAMNADIREIEDKFCRTIYKEARSLVEDGDIPDNLQDIFLEQVLLCGAPGFENFMRDDWMRMALSWQRPTGCFTADYAHKFQSPLEPQSHPEQLTEAEADAETNKAEMESSVMEDLKHEADMMENRYKGRKLLRESAMSDGCMAHKTGLGFGSLSVFLRYLVRDLYVYQ